MALRRLLLLMLAAIGGCRAESKHWMVDVDWDSPANWQGGVPRLDSRVVFTEGMRHAVSMPRRTDASFSGLELPWDGIVGLPENGKIALSEKAKAARSVYTRVGPYFWVDPQNWNGSSEAVPHLERVPCQGDVAVLPESSRTFSMRLPESRVVEVAGVRIADQPRSIPRWEWRDMSDRAEFLGSSLSIRYSPLISCEDCNCQEGELRDYWEEVCNVQRPRCGLSSCLYPLKVEGHCCYYCGGRVRLSKATLLSSAQRVATSALAAYEGQLFWHSRRTWDGQVEILITERGAYEGSNVIIATTDLQAALKEDGLDVLYTETSGEPMYDYRLAVALGPFLGVFLALLFLVILAFPVFGYTYSQMWEACSEVADALCGGSSAKAGRKRRSIAFARFENAREGSVQLAEEEAAQQAAAGGDGGERFENPLYEPRRQLDPGEPVSLVALARAAELDRPDDVDMDIENL